MKFTNHKLRMNRAVVLSETPPFPHNMLMELTNTCNHKCVFCGYKDMKRKKHICEKELMFDLMDQAYKNGTREIGFYMIGEPLMCADLADYVARAHKLGFEYIYLTTNGGLADLTRMRTLVDAGLNSVKFSVNGATPETYEAVHGKDDFEVVKNNIRALRIFTKENDIDFPMFISFVRNEINKNDVTVLHDIFDDFVDQIYIVPCANQAGGMLGLVSNGVVLESDLLPGSTVPCEMIFNRLHITCEGYLNACCADVDGYLSAIDLHTTKLEDAWNSEILKRLRRQHLDYNLDRILCYNCTNRTDAEVIPLNKDLMLRNIASCTQ